MSESFLGRWARRKAEARRAEPPDETAAPAAEQGAPEAESAAEPSEADVSSAAASTPEAEPALSAEEIAELPPIESLAADSDITAFLRKGVPQALRNAALRRIWLLDPKIRDFVGEARDYDWDWNTPGGVPGGGPLRAGEDVAAMVDRMFSRGEAAPQPASEGAAPAGTNDTLSPRHGAEPQAPAEDAAQGAAPDGGGSDAPRAEDTPAGQDGSAPAEAPESLRGDATVQVDPPAAQPQPGLAGKRRHGGAMPV